MIEIWKDVAGYEGYYQISNLGRAKSLDRVVKRKNQPDLPLVGKILKPRTGKNGYDYVILRRDGKGKTAYIHRLVAEMFIENPCGFNVVNHKDGNKGNNTCGNLEWCNSQRNNQHAFETGLISKENIAKSVMNPNKLSRNNTSGRKGVYYNRKLNKWMAYIKHNGKMLYLGVYEEKADAIKARERKEREFL